MRDNDLENCSIKSVNIAMDLFVKEIYRLEYFLDKINMLLFGDTGHDIEDTLKEIRLLKNI